MKTFQLSRFALNDVREMLLNRARFFGVEAADQLQDEFLVALSALAAPPGLGHRRQDLTARPYFFYTLEPYLIV